MLDDLLEKLRHRFRSRHGYAEFDSFMADALTPGEAAALSASPLGRIFVENKGRLIHKWLHFFPVYERYFARYVGTPLHFLEIGVSGGGSLDMWRQYFGDAATIFGIDIDAACADRVSAPNQVRIGSQADSEFLASVIAETGPLDVILDDGSHIAEHQRVSFEELWPQLKHGGLYMIEDTHTAYWAGWQGGMKRKGTAVEIAKDIVDDMHGWYHDAARQFVGRDEVGGVHFHDSIIVIEKAHVARPKNVRIPPAA